jgi:restriction endonuclease S subunit
MNHINQMNYPPNLCFNINYLSILQYNQNVHISQMNHDTKAFYIHSINNESSNKKSTNKSTHKSINKTKGCFGICHHNFL